MSERFLEHHDLGMVGDKRLVLVLDTNPRRCKGLGRYCVRCKREGEPVDGEFWCYAHAAQREWCRQTEVRRIDAEGSA